MHKLVARPWCERLVRQCRGAAASSAPVSVTETLICPTAPASASVEADLLYAKPGAETAVLATAVFSASCAPAMGALPPTGMTAAVVAVAAPPSMFCTADLAGGGGGLRRAGGF